MAEELEIQTNPVNNKEEFEKWLFTRESNKGEPYSPGTPKNYVNGLTSSHPAFKEEYGQYNGAFAINDPAEFARVVAAIKAKKSYSEFRKRKGGLWFSAAAKQYQAFLSGEGPNREKRKGAKDKGDENGESGSVTKSGSTGGKSEYPRNWIIFGAPGTGKSYELNKKRKELLGEENNTRCTRVTFHPDYSYAHFVGTYKPVPKKKKDEMKDGEGGITYKYIPGPFMETYVKAKKEEGKPHLLIIEEINRANVAAVFGDVFQLLDRDENGKSEYPVKASIDIRDYLEENGVMEEELTIPPNMYIWATMNSADQGVFPMDTAFKRRWDFKYLDIDHGSDADKISGKMVPLKREGGQQAEWNEVRKFINELLSDIGINEDKLLGAFFINGEIIAKAESDEETFRETFKDKVLMYLFEDAAKHKRKDLFKGKYKRYSQIRTAFDAEGLDIFERRDIELPPFSYRTNNGRGTVNPSVSGSGETESSQETPAPSSQS